MIPIYKWWLQYLRYQTAIDHYRYRKCGDYRAASQCYKEMHNYDRKLQALAIDTLSR